MANQQHAVAAAIRQYAEKLASQKAAANEGAPDRMTTADGQGGITTTKATIPADVGQAELEVRQPADGTPVRVSAPSGAPDRMTTADGQGGITAAKGTIPTDPGQAELEVRQPMDGTPVKAAMLTQRAARLRDAILGANPALAAKLTPAAPAPAPAVKAAFNAATTPAGVPSLNLSTEALCKIARVVLSSEAGISLTHDLLEKQAGDEAARAQILEAVQAHQVYDQAEQIKQAAFDDFSEKTLAIHNSLRQAGITEADADSILKQAAVHQEALNAFDDPMLKAAYAQGTDDAALMAAAEESAGAEGAPPVDEALPMGGEQLSEEDIMALLEEMLASGKITEDDIREAVAMAGGGAGGAPAEGGMPPEAAAAEEAAMAGQV